MKQTDQQRIQKILDFGNKLCTYIEDQKITPKDLLANITIQWTVTTPLYNIGEQTYRLSAETKEAYNDVPWMMISGLRHRLVHDYEGTNWNIIAAVVFEELPAFLRRMEEIYAEFK